MIFMISDAMTSKCHEHNWDINDVVNVADCEFSSLYGECDYVYVLNVTDRYIDIRLTNSIADIILRIDERGHREDITNEDW